MDLLGLILAIGLGLVELAIAVPLTLLPLKADREGAPGCSRLLPILILIPMTLINVGLFLFLKADGTFLQKFGLTFGGSTLIAIGLIVGASRLDAMAPIGPRRAFLFLAVFVLLSDLYFLVLLGRPGPGPVLTIDPVLAFILSLVGLPAALVVLALLSSRRQLPSPPREPEIGDVHYLPPSPR